MNRYEITFHLPSGNKQTVTTLTRDGVGDAIRKAQGICPANADLPFTVTSWGKS